MMQSGKSKMSELKKPEHIIEDDYFTNPKNIDAIE